MHLDECRKERDWYEFGRRLKRDDWWAQRDELQAECFLDGNAFSSANIHHGEPMTRT